MGHRTGVSRHPTNGEERIDWPGSAHEATRFILAQVPGCRPVEGGPTDAERIGHGEDAPVLVEPELIEPPPFRAVRFTDAGSREVESGFTGFLDGTQEVRVVNQMHGIPIVWATVAAAVRARMNRKLVSWKEHEPIVSRRFYIPFRYVESLSDDLRENPLVTDTAKETASGKIPSRHPAALMEAAIQKVQQDRERIELDLAEAWSARENGALYMDGSITGSAIASKSPLIIGVVKSHRRLYAEGDAFRVLVDLDVGERSSIFRVASGSRHAVASWYVRVRSSKGRDALFGLVRIEAAHTEDISTRANEISRWIIAEGAPLALPDGRWDKMAYGIRHTEEFLRAIS